MMKIGRSVRTSNSVEKSSSKSTLESLFSKSILDATHDIVGAFEPSAFRANALGLLDRRKMRESEGCLVEKRAFGTRPVLIVTNSSRQGLAPSPAPRDYPLYIELLILLSANLPPVPHRPYPNSSVRAKNPSLYHLYRTTRKDLSFSKASLFVPVSSPRSRSFRKKNRDDE